MKAGIACFSRWFQKIKINQFQYYWSSTLWAWERKTMRFAILAPLTNLIMLNIFKKKGTPWRSCFVDIFGTNWKPTTENPHYPNEHTKILFFFHIIHRIWTSLGQKRTYLPESVICDTKARCFFKLGTW